MKKEILQQKITAMEKELAEMNAELNKPDKSNIELATEWLVNFMNENDGKFTVKVKDGFHTYYRGDQWLFQLDFKNKTLWFYYYKVLYKISNQFSLEYNEVQLVIANVVGEAINCKEFTPINCKLPEMIRVGEALNCKAK